MRIFAYEVRDDELRSFEFVREKYNVEIITTKEAPCLENVDFATDCEGVSVSGNVEIDADLLEHLYDVGVRYISTRTIGINHINVKAAKRLGIKVCNSTYPPNGVADFTIMMMLMCLRNYKQAMWRGQINDFSLPGLIGKDMNSLTVGIMGCGRVGFQVIKELQGFGCRILAYDMYENEEVKKYATYVDKEEIFKECDMISLHLPLVENTYHIINDKTISKMKDGVILINCARGALTDVDALVNGLECGKIGALGMDTVEGDEGIIHGNHKSGLLANRNWFYLHQFKNVILTQHMAFYTEQAVHAMVVCGIEGIIKMAEEGTYYTEIK